MAYMNQAKKKLLAPAVKVVLNRYGMKGTLSVRNHSTLVMTLTGGMLEFKSGTGINPYWYQNHFAGKQLDFLKDLFYALNVGNHDNSDSQIDYFDVGWYVDVNIGTWSKPYEVFK